MATTLKSAAKIVATPITKPLSAVYRRAVIAQRFALPDVASQVEAAQAAGTDIAAASTRQYFDLQLKLLPYRVTKLKEEIDCLAGEGSSLSNYTYKNWIIFVRFAVRVVFLFMVGTMVGRQSVYPSLLPDSVFAVELERKYRSARAAVAAPPPQTQQAAH